MFRALLTFVIAAAVLGSPVETEARTSRETTYRYSQIWSSAVRFLRVDNGFAIREQDKSTGYVLFVYPDAGRSFMGAVELVSTVRNNRKYINVTVRIQDMPSYVEVVLADKLLRKLKNEYGEPPPPETALDIPEGRANSPEDNDAQAAEGTEDPDRSGEVSPPAKEQRNPSDD